MLGTGFLGKCLCLSGPAEASRPTTGEAAHHRQQQAALGSLVTHKAACRCQAREWWQGEERRRAADESKQGWAPWLQWDCHTACADGSHFARNLKAAVAEFAYDLKQERSVDMPLIRLRDHLSYIKVGAPRASCPACMGLARIQGAWSHLT